MTVNVSSFLSMIQSWCKDPVHVAQVKTAVQDTLTGLSLVAQLNPGTSVAAHAIKAGMVLSSGVDAFNMGQVMLTQVQAVTPESTVPVPPAP